MARQKSTISNNLSFVLDTSVVVKWFTREEDSVEAKKIREDYLKGKCKILVPDLLFYELSNALKFAGLKPKEVVKNINTLYELNIPVQLFYLPLIEISLELMQQKPIAIYDAYFLSLAESLRFLFITADEKLYNIVSNLKYVRLLKDI